MDHRNRLRLPGGPAAARDAVEDPGKPQCLSGLVPFGAIGDPELLCILFDFRIVVVKIFGVVNAGISMPSSVMSE
jgi:hypothetical protein